MKIKKNKSKKKKRIASLHLDKQTSHGGWPKGENRGWVDSRPVNKQISDYLEKMGLLSSPSHARLSESLIRHIVKKFILEWHI